MIMKKNYIKIMAAAASLLLFACCQENEIEIGGEPGVVGENTIAFAIGKTQTRAASVSASELAEQGAIIPIGTDENGRQFVLEESIIDLNSPITRGTPVYTENVFNVYPTLYAHSALEDIKVGGDIFTYNESTTYYTSIQYGTNIWDKGETVTVDGNSTKQLKFWMYMPSNITDYGVTLGDTPFGETNGKQTISFSYVSHGTAEEQADIIFSARAITEEEYNSNDKVADVLFHHALTGIKFAIGNDTDDDVTITSVAFSGLHTSASCVVTPRMEKQSSDSEEGEETAVEYAYIDNPTGDHSSTDEATVHWTLPSTPITKNLTATFTKTVDFAQGAGTFKEGNVSKGKYPASFSAAGNTNNLNDGNATQTFWLIPQPMSNNVKLTITYKIGNGAENTWTVDFGSALGDVTWKAGQLRTYTIKIDDVNVKIEDAVTITQPEGGYETIKDEIGNTYNAVSYKGSTKTGVTITNTGNTDAYIRAALVGQWLDADGNPVFGFTDFSDPENVHVVLVDSWYEDQFVNPEAGTHGTFVGLPGYKGASADLNNWHYNSSDGYYYYKNPVPANTAVPDALFTKYTVGSTPAVAVAGKVQDVYFVLEIATQAISANKLDGTQYSWEEAWANAKATN